MTRDPGEVLQTPVTSWVDNQKINNQTYYKIPHIRSPLDRESHSICVTLTEKDRSKDWPEVTVVSTMGELLESPMSMYTVNMRVNPEPQPGDHLTVGPGVGAADAWHGGTPGHDEQVVPALAVGPLWLGQHEVGKVKSKGKLNVYFEDGILFYRN